MNSKPYWLLTTIFFGSFLISHAQNITIDSIEQVKIKTRLINYFNENINERAEIYNGILYEMPEKAYKGSVFFKDNNHFSKGEIRYNGYYYSNIPIMFDVFNSLMVVSSPAQINFILFGKKVEDIYLLDHHFIYLSATGHTGISEGYFDELYDGNTSVLVKRYKSISSSVSETRVEVTYTDEIEIYLKNGSKYFRVNSKNDILEVLKDKKKELYDFLETSKIKFNKDKEASVVTLAKFYDQITK